MRWLFVLVFIVCSHLFLQHTLNGTTTDVNAFYRLNNVSKGQNTLSCKINESKGVYALHFTFAAEEKESFIIDWFKFK
jgi:hypothetical protein